MEETNYHRVPCKSAPPQHALSPDVKTLCSKSFDQKATELKTYKDEPSIEPDEASRYKCNRKTYIEKLALFQKSDLRQPNRLAGMMLRPLIFLSFPIVLYAGFSYGSNLVVSRNQISF